MIGKVFLVVGMLVVCSCIVSASVQISEVLYDPITTESGGEAVELYNPESFAVNISGWVLKTESSAQDAVIPKGTVMEAGSYYLIADAGFSTNKDDPSWNDADHEEAITLTNSNAGVALLDNLGSTVDAVGWGLASGIDAGLFEGTPANQVTAGNSLARSQDTNNNLNDFSESFPDLRNSNSASGGMGGAANFSTKIAFTVTVSNSLSRIVSFIIGDEDPIENGTQILPMPKSKKIVNVEVGITNEIGHEYIGDVILGFKEGNITLNKSSVVNATNAVFTGEIDFEFYDEPGIYNISVMLLNNTEDMNEFFDVEYQEMLAYDIDSVSIACDARVGQTCVAGGDLDMNSTDKTTIRNIGNINLDFELYGGDLVDGANVIDVSNLGYAFGGFAFQALGADPVLNSVNLENSEASLIDLSFELDIPAGTKSGEYFSEIMINGVSS